MSVSQSFDDLAMASALSTAERKMRRLVAAADPGLAAIYRHLARGLQDWAGSDEPVPRSVLKDISKLQRALHSLHGAVDEVQTSGAADRRSKHVVLEMIDETEMGLRDLAGSFRSKAGRTAGTRAKSSAAAFKRAQRVTPAAQRALGVRP
jgi:hypothetical protein